MDFELKTEYWNDPVARRAFQEFTTTIFDLDFLEWESGGYWDSRYTPFSFFKGETMVASVCAYLLDAYIQGKSARLAQISAVGTLPEWRRRGLNRELTGIALDWAEEKQEGIFLFASAEAIPFYQKCGFQSIDEHVEIVPVKPLPNCGGIVKLDPRRSRDLDTIYQYAKRRTPISNRFSVMNAKLIMFHAIYLLRDHLYLIPDLDCLVFFKREGGRLTLFDIVGEKVPLLEELYPYIAGDEDKTIEFHFHTDKLGISKVETRPLVGNNPFVRGAFPLSNLVFPFTSRA